MMKKYYIAHHGIKGQEWGVRNGPPYPIDHKVMKKGTKLSSVRGKRASAIEDQISKLPMFFDPAAAVTGLALATSIGVGRDIYNKVKDRGKLKKMIYTFNPADEHDSKVYKGAYATALYMRNRNNKLNVYNYETTKDLKMATRNDRVNAFKTIYNDEKYKKSIHKDILNIYSRLTSDEDTLKRLRKKGFLPKKNDFDIDNIKTDKDYGYAYNLFTAVQDGNSPGAKAFIKAISTDYDAMVDDYNVNIYNDAHDPVIIFKTDKALALIGKEKLTDEDVKKNLDKLKKETEQIAL